LIKVSVKDIFFKIYLETGFARRGQRPAELLVKVSVKDIFFKIYLETGFARRGQRPAELLVKVSVKDIFLKNISLDGLRPPRPKACGIIG
jgi:hypothetical protein